MDMLWNMCERYKIMLLAFAANLSKTFELIGCSERTQWCFVFIYLFVALLVVCFVF
jgi:hypothetical protein